MRRVAMVLVVAGSFALTLPARADTLEAPAEVMATADGSFHYTATFHKGPGSGQFAGYSWAGIQNVAGGLYADCFCLPSCPIYSPGYTFTFDVDGQLTNPALPGSVGQSVGFCDAGGASSTTAVRPFDPAGIAPHSPVIDAALWNEPNPFTARTTLHYRLPESGPVSLGVYDLTGRLVVRLVDEVQTAGAHEVMWNARAETARGGVLFARLALPGQVRTRTLILIP
jgi:hypothetical protein